MAEQTRTGAGQSSGGQVPQSREEISQLVDQRIAAALGIRSEEVKQYEPEDSVERTISIVTVTVRIHC